MDKKSMFAGAMAILVGVGALHAATLTEEQFLKQALKDHPEISAANAEVQIQAGAGVQARTYSNPELSLEIEDPDNAARQDTWKMSWKLPFDGRKHRVAAATAEEAAARAALENTELQTRLEMQFLFAEWYVETERSEVLNWALTRAEELASRLRARADIGEASGVEARRLELEVEILRRRTGATRAGKLAAQSAAAAWNSLVTDQIQPEQPPLSMPPETSDFDGHPEIQALAHQVEAAQAGLLFHRRQIEAPTVSVGWLKIEEEGRSLDGPALGLSWPVPIFDRNKGNRRKAEATVDRARSHLESGMRQVKEQVETASVAYRELYEIHGGNRTDGDDELLINAIFSAFEAGEADLTDVLDSLRTIIEVRLARLDTLADTLAAERDLEAALGQAIPQGGNS